MTSIINNSLKNYQKVLIIVASLISIILSSIVIFGWALNIPLFIQIRPDFVPMQFNTALCFILAGLTFYSLNTNLQIKGLHLHYVFGTILFIISSLSFSQYIIGNNLGIDELFFKHYIHVKSKYPGRMSPNTATCFILVSLLSFSKILTIELRKKLIVSLIISSLIVSFSATSFISYMLGIDVAFAWQESTRMAVHTSFIFLTLSSTSFYLVMMRIRQRSIYNWIPIPTTLIFLVFFVITAQFIRQNEKQTIDQTILNDARVVTGKVQALMREKLKALERMAMRLAIERRNDKDRWLEDAKSYYYDFKYFPQLEVYLNNPPRHWKYPKRELQENLEQTRTKELVIYNTKIKKTSLLGPTVLKGKRERFAYLASPIIDNNKVLGTQVITIDIETLFDSVFKDVETEWFKVTVLENDRPIYKSFNKEDKNQGKINTFLLDTMNGSWEISLSPKSSYIALLSSSTPELIIYFGIIISMLAGLLVYNYQNIKMAKQEAQYQERLKSSILANMSHEVRTPMNGILGIVEILTEEYSDPNIREKVDIIKSSSESLLKTINNILDLTKIEASKFELDIEVFDLNSLIKDVVTLHSLEANKKNTTITYSMENDFPDLIKADPYRLRQVLNNVLSNAVKFTSNGSINLKVSYETVDDNYLKVKIDTVDTGIGIEGTNITRVFEDYEQANKNTINEYGGTGLGLSITKKIVELLNGSISITSKHSEGTRVSFNFKCEEGHKSEKTERLFIKGRNNQINALIADDSEVNLKILERHLVNMKISVKKALNGEDALIKMEEEDFNIVFLDYHMPKLDGLETAKLITKKYENKPMPVIICLTGNTNIEDHQKLKAAGADHILIKPINKAIIKGVIDKFSNRLHLKESTMSRDQSILSTLITKDDLLLKFDGDKQLLLESIALLLNSLPSMVKRIEKSFHEKDFRNLQLNAHSYRSSMANFHIIPAIKYAEVIEKSAINQDIEEIDINLTKLKKITKISKEKLRRISSELGS